MKGDNEWLVGCFLAFAGLLAGLAVEAMLVYAVFQWLGGQL